MTIMNVITTTAALAEFCKACAQHPYVTVDTEFLRERTYYSQLCLVQLAYSGVGNDHAALIDTLAPGLDLAPLYDLFRDANVLKVFHAARQDLEIFVLNAGVVPEPFFDTQVAAMVCGFGDQVGYDTLARKITKENIDKSSRFTDWSCRPLSNAQMNYALADVTHLRDVYEFLAAKLEKTGRAHWVKEELATLTDPNTYIIDPKTAWQRVKTRNNNGKFLAIVRELAEFRENDAQTRDVPRSRVMKDDALLELAALRPTTPEELGRARLLQREGRKPAVTDAILAAIARGLACKVADQPKVAEIPERKQGSGALGDLLRVLLKAKSDQADVAAKLIASAADLDSLACDATPNLPCLHGWRREVFGNDALRLISGEVALSAGPNGVKIVQL